MEGGGRHASRDSNEGEERERDNSDFIKALTEAVTGKTSKTKLTKVLKQTVLGFMRIDFDNPAISEVAARWKELDEVQGDKLATMTKVQEHLEEVGKDLGVDPAGQLLAYDMFKRTCSKESCSYQYLAWATL